MTKAPGRYFDAFATGGAKGAGSVAGMLLAIWVFGLWPEFVALLEALIGVAERFAQETE